MFSYLGKFKKTGFSLVEAVIAIGMTGIIIVMYQNVMSSILLSRSIKNTDIAVKIASNQIEELRADGYSSLPNSGSFSDSLLSSLPSGSASMNISDYNDKIKLVVVTVSWSEPNSGSRSVSLQTLVAQTGSFK